MIAIKRIRKELTDMMREGYHAYLDNWDLYLDLNHNKIKIQVSESYPFKPPTYYIQICPPNTPCLTRALSIKYTLPDSVENHIQSMIRKERYIYLKKYLYQTYRTKSEFSQGEEKARYTQKSLTIMNDYARDLSPYVWSPAMKLIDQVKIIQDYLSNLVE